MIRRTILGTVFALAATTAAQASVEISSNPTHNMNCADGVCTPTAKNADLNATDLANMLASGEVKVVTGSGAVTITVSQSFSWTSTHRLTLDAYYNVSFRAPVVVAGQGAVTIVTNDGGTGGDLIFFPGASLDFWDTSSSLVINDSSYVLAKDIRTLASGIGSHPGRAFALGTNYDAADDGTYTNPPISATFRGTFEGLGHTIDHLTIIARRVGSNGLFAQTSGLLRDLHLTNASVTTVSHPRHYTTPETGVLVGGSSGTIHRCDATGTVHSGKGLVGGLAGLSATIELSWSNVILEGAHEAGGLTGLNLKTISRSFAMGSISGSRCCGSGGLAGENLGLIEQSFAMTAVSGYSGRGGILAANDSSGVMRETYSTGAVSTEAGLFGGAIGQDFSAGGVMLTYWDMDTSGVSDPSQGAGSPANDPGITGLTDAQLKSGLPPGFDPQVWGQNPSINNGYPYLLANPPPQ